MKLSVFKQNGENQIMKGGEIMDYNVKIEDEKNYGIYMIRNKVNNKKYIGQTRSGFRIRYTKHVSGFKTGRGHSKNLLKIMKSMVQIILNFLYCKLKMM